MSRPLDGCRAPSQGGRWPKAQSSIGHGKDFWTLGIDDDNVRRHARAEAQVFVVYVDDGIVGDDVLKRGRSIANLPDLAGEALPRKRVDCEIGLHPHFEAPDVAFGHVGVDLHLRQVLRNREERRRR